LFLIKNNVDIWNAKAIFIEDFVAARLSAASTHLQTSNDCALGTRPKIEQTIGPLHIPLGIQDAMPAASASILERASFLNTLRIVRSDAGDLCPGTES
jgi:hypothetical protein